MIFNKMGWWKGILGRENSTSKGPEAGVCGQVKEFLDERRGHVFGVEGNRVRLMESLWILRKSAFRKADQTALRMAWRAWRQ